MASFTLVVAAAENNVIGDGTPHLPWTLKSDTSMYKSFSQDKPVIIGRVTRELLGFIHSDILEVVLSRNKSYMPTSSIVARSIDEAISAVNGFDEVVVLGGASIYSQFEPLASRILLTRVKTNSRGSKFFHFSEENWWVYSKKSYGVSEQDEYSFCRIDLRRKLRGKRPSQQAGSVF
jgi:dihydrofolate reductase